MKLKIVFLLLVQIIILNSCAKSNSYLNKKFLNANEDFSIIIKEDELEFYGQNFSKDSESLTKKVLPYNFQKLNPYNKLITEQNNYGLFYCNINSIDFLTLIKPDKEFYKNWTIPLTYFEKNKKYLYIPVLNGVTVEKASSYISEKSKTEELIFLPECWNLYRIPWAVSSESADKSICFKLKGSFSKEKYEPVKKLVFVNGFISASKDYLYTQNSRAKNIEISYDGITFIRKLEDIADYQVIELEKKINVNSNSEVKIEILDYYQGSKYSDIVISAVLFPEIISN